MRCLFKKFDEIHMKTIGCLRGINEFLKRFLNEEIHNKFICIRNVFGGSESREIL